MGIAEARNLAEVAKEMDIQTPGSGLEWLKQQRDIFQAKFLSNPTGKEVVSVSASGNSVSYQITGKNNTSLFHLFCEAIRIYEGKASTSFRTTSFIGASSL